MFRLHVIYVLVFNRPSCLCYISSVSRLYGMYCAKRCVLKQKLLLTAYKKSYLLVTKSRVNDLAHLYIGRSRSFQLLRHIAYSPFMGKW